MKTNRNDSLLIGNGEKRSRRIKRACALGAVLAGVLCAFCGCSKPDDTDVSSDVSADTSSDVRTNTDSLSGTDALLLDAMNSKVAFISETGKSQLFKDYPIISFPEEVPKEFGVAEKYTFVDLDQDGTNELVLYTPSDDGAFVVFHYDSEDQNIYGYTVNPRFVIVIRVDGRFSGSSGAANTYISKMSFDKTQYTLTRLAVYDEYPGSPYFEIGGQPVTEAEADAYFNEWESVEECKWFANTDPLTGTDALLLDAMNSKVTFTDEFGTKRLFKDFPIPPDPKEIADEWAVAKEYTFVDLDQDGVDELAVYTTSDYGAYVILRYDSEDQTIYGYMIGIRSFQDVRVDGRFSGSWGAFSHDIAIMSFNKNQFTRTTLAVNDKHPNNLDFEIAGLPVAETEADAYFNEWESVEKSQWLTEGIIAAE